MNVDFLHPIPYILESDSLYKVEALKKSSPDLSRQGPLADEIKCLLASFKSFEVLHVLI